MQRVMSNPGTPAQSPASVTTTRPTSSATSQADPANSQQV